MTFKPDMTLEQIKGLCDLHGNHEAIFCVGTVKELVKEIQLLRALLMSHDELLQGCEK